LPDDEVIARAVSYLQYLTAVQENMCDDRTILMDETAVYFDDPRMVTVDNIGARHVVMRSTGYQSMRITAVLAVTANGRKVQPLLIWKGKSQEIVSVNGCWVAQQPRAWVDQPLLIKWLDRAFPMLWVGSTKHVVWDSMRAHIGKDVKAHCVSRGINMCVVPGGMTPYLHAGDIGIYKSFKDIMSRLIDDWKNSGSVQYTAKGNPRPPSVEIVSDWVRQAWRLVPAEVVNHSIACAGFADDYTEWHIARHDVYGERFVAAWNARADEDVADDVLEDIESDLCDALDDITLIEP
jgi:DDE superfamily endonuclease